MLVQESVSGCWNCIIGILLAAALASPIGLPLVHAAVGHAEDGASRTSLDQTAVRADIAAYRRDAYSAHLGGATERLFTFARKSREVDVIIDAGSLPFLSRDPPIDEIDVLLGAFVAGNIAPQLADGIKENRQIDGIEAMCAAYRQLREQGRIEEIEVLDAWSKVTRRELPFAVLQAESIDVTPKRTTTGGSHPYRHEPSGFEFKPEMAHSVLGRAIRYRDERLGEAVSYQTPEGGVMTIIFYRPNGAPIEGGPESSAALAEFSGAISSVQKMKDEGLYTVARCVEADWSRLKTSGKVPAFNVAECQLARAEAGQDVVSWILVSTIREHIVKIRYSAPRTAEVRARELLSRFLDALFESQAP